MKYVGKNGLRIGGNEVWHEGNFNPKDIPYDKLLFANGLRNKIYKLGTYKRGAGSGSSGECVLYCDRLGNYGSPGAAIWQCSYTGTIFEKIEGLCNNYAKNLYIYRDTEEIASATNFTIYLEAPNFNDGYSIYIQKAWNVNFDVVDVTEAWEDEVADKILTSRTPVRGSKALTGLHIGGKLYASEDIVSSDADNIAVNKKYVDNKVKTDVPANAKFTDTTYGRATASADGLMSKEDKGKLDGVATGANKTDIIDDLTSTDATKALSAKQGKELKSLVDGKWTYNETIIKGVKVNNAGNADTVSGKTVAENVPSGAKFTDTVYTHPATHPASMITESTTKRFVSDTEKSTWNSNKITVGKTQPDSGWWFEEID